MIRIVENIDEPDRISMRSIASPSDQPAVRPEVRAKCLPRVVMHDAIAGPHSAAEEEYEHADGDDDGEDDCVALLPRVDLFQDGVHAWDLFCGGHDPGLDALE